MDSTAQLGQLLRLAEAVAGTNDPVRVLEAALPALLAVAEAEAVLVVSQVEPTPETPRRTIARAGAALPADALVELPVDPDHLVSAPVPHAWQVQGVRHLAVRQLPGHVGLLVLARREAEAGDDVASNPLLDLALTHVLSEVGRAIAQEALADLSARVDNAQLLANMGDYDWHIPTDTNTWSDQLFRIYGHEPQSFHPNYERFLSFIHPEDRELITGIHQHAYATGEPYKMIERIMRPSGEVRYLASNGEVIMDAEGTPVRMRGTCIDITDRVLADRETARSAARFQSLVQSAPDAMLVLDDTQHILECNQRAREMLGADPHGHDIREVLPTWPPEENLAVRSHDLGGGSVVLDVITSPVSDDHEDSDTAPGEDNDAVTAVYLRDAQPRLESEALAARLGEVRLRRRQALEINDNVVQGLVAAAYALDQEQATQSRAYLDQTLTAARAMMDDLLEPLDGEDLQPGDLVRTAPASIGVPPETATTHLEDDIERKDTHTVLVVDDAEDLRMLLRARMETRHGLTVVGEAADGLTAVELASELQPDLVMLDLAMPRMDGLEALPLIRAAVPGVRVIVLSGFNQNTLAEKAIEAGADRYVVKGGSMRQLLELVEMVLDQAS
jgi:PAS domain S-box-containing protein